MNSGNSAPPDGAAVDPAALGRILARLAPGRPWWVAYSGGADSLALLHALARVEPDVRAVHVDHGLHPDSGRWAAHCRAVARTLGVALRVERVDVRAGGDGPEGAARRARYAAFRRVLAGGGSVLTAHHRDDQAETLLLQLLRGTGLAGLAGMPVIRSLGEGSLVRPWLDRPRPAIRAYAEATGFQSLEDPSNNDPALDRNYLRLQVWPLLEARWPDVGARVSRAARHAGTALGVLDRLADAVLGEPGPTLALARIAAFGPEERAWLVRRWLIRRGVRPPGERRLLQGLADLAGAAADRSPALVWADAQIRRHRDRLVLLPPRLPRPAAPVTGRGAEPVELDDGSRLAFREADGGIPPALLGGGWRLRPRVGGERLRLHGHRHAVKKLLQEAGLPPWEKAALPLVYIDDALAAVPGVAVADGFRGARGLMPYWTPAWADTGRLPGPPTGDDHGEAP